MTAPDTAAIRKWLANDADDDPEGPAAGIILALCDALDTARFDNRITNALLDGTMRRVTTLRAENARLVEAANQARLAFAGYVTVQSAIDKLDAALAAVEATNLEPDL